MYKSNCILFLLIPSSGGLSVPQLSVPPAVVAGTDRVILDCLYNFTHQEASQLRLRWFYNQDPMPFYQWIAGRDDSKPQVIGRMFKDKIDKRYMVSREKYTRHRAIMIKMVSMDMTGTYTCMVDTLTREVISEANMIVYSPATSSQYRQARLPGDRTNLSCQFSGVYPVPVVRIALGRTHLVEDGRQVDKDHHHYSVQVWKIFTLQEEKMGLGCSMSLPGTGYEVVLKAGVRDRQEQEIIKNDIKMEEEILCILIRSVTILILGALVMSSMLNYACRKNYFSNYFKMY